MQTQHTPGPWRYCKTNGSPTHGEHVIAGSKPGYLAEVRDCGSGDVGANARLIAAAPELLAALVELRDWYTEHTGLPAVAANAAIAKAVGHNDQAQARAGRSDEGAKA